MQTESIWLRPSSSSSSLKEWKELALSPALLYKVGEGKKVYESACKALSSWKHMSLGWVETNKPPLQVGSKVCIAARMLCFWQRNPLQIVYVTDAQQSSNKLQESSQERISDICQGMLDYDSASASGLLSPGFYLMHNSWYIAIIKKSMCSSPQSW